MEEWTKKLIEQTNQATCNLEPEIKIRKSKNIISELKIITNMVPLDSSGIFLPTVACWVSEIS
jgi:hypothetical protein